MLVAGGHKLCSKPWNKAIQFKQIGGGGVLYMYITLHGGAGGTRGAGGRGGGGTFFQAVIYLFTSLLLGLKAINLSISQ